MQNRAEAVWLVQVVGSERLGLAAQQRVAKAVVQTGERPDFERATSSGAPARPGPITSGVPQHRIDQPAFRISAPFLDAPLPVPAQVPTHIYPVAICKVFSQGDFV